MCVCHAQGTSVLNIGGVAESSPVGGVLIWRPLLRHHKGEIYEYAHRYGVAYFKDTTPAWSTRGRLRGSLLPAIEGVYGEGYRGHLTALARDSALCAQLLEEQLFAPLRARVRCSPLAVWLDTAAHAALPLFFWKEALRHVCEQRLGIGLVKEKAVATLLKRLRAQRRGGGGGGGGGASWLALKKESKVLLAGGTLVFFRPRVFGGRHEVRTA